MTNPVHIDTPSILLSTHALGVGFKERPLLTDLSVDLSGGEFICLIGVNGSGKTTLLKSLGGLHPPLAGRVTLGGETVSSLSLKALSSLRSISLTDSYQSANLTVAEFISQGKWQSFNWQGKLPADDENLIKEISTSLQLTSFLHLPIYQLSDGERQRAVLARALVQDCQVILLDEPLSHLDPIYRHQLMDDMRSICHSQGKGIIITTHDWELALAYADTLWWITDDQALVCGGPEDLILNGFISQQLQHTPLQLELASGKLSLPKKLAHPVHVQGAPIPLFWTQQGLRKIGIQALHRRDLPIRIYIHAAEHHHTWELHSPKGEKSFDSLTLLLGELEKLLAAS